MEITKLRALYDDEREEAYQQAKLLLAGPEPDPSVHMRRVFPKYPRSLVYLTLCLGFILLMSAFLPSAYRLYAAGSSAFCQKEMFSSLQCQTVGMSTIVLAETGQIVFFLCLASLATSAPSRRIFWGGIGLTTSIALIGNWHQSRPDLNHWQIFYILETLSPPIVVMGLGYALKEYMLAQMEERYLSRLEYEQVLVLRREKLLSPEKFGQEWYRALSKSLKSALRQVHRRVPGLNELTSDDWKYLIRREFKAMDWVVTPHDLSLLDRQETVVAVTSQLTSGGFSDAEVFPTPGTDLWTARSLETGVTLSTEYRTANRARAGLRSHLRAHLKRYQMGRGPG